jgi:hypothetical protein
VDIIKNFGDRQQLLHHLRHDLQRLTTAVEVGTWRGDFAMMMMNILEPENFFCVDPFAIFPGMVSRPDSAYDNQLTLDELAERTRRRMVGRGGDLIRQKSVDGANQFMDNDLDVVYLDGDHTYQGVKQDLEAWWPKVRAGGYLCGDDYITGSTGQGFQFGVIEAVNEFAEQQNMQLVVYVSRQPQWLIRKG